LRSAAGVSARPRYRSVRLHSLRLEMKLTEDDMPDALASAIQPA
jgi:hypothetical protein